MTTAELFKAVESIIGPVYLVGGSVRDLIMGLDAKDFDFCTPVLPDEIEERVRAAGRRPYLVGKRFGTIGFKLSGSFIEVTTFRQEHYSKDNRRPEVDFVSDIYEDLARRDFTINAIAVDLDSASGEMMYIDPSEGRKDIEKRIIRSVGEPGRRITEDPLRMLRAARFASQLDFEVDGELAGKIHKRAKSIMTISKERWVTELDKLLTSKNPVKGLRLLSDTELLKYILPELWLQVGFDQDSPYHSLSLWDHTLKVVELSEADADMRWAALLHDVGKPFARGKNKRGYSNYVYHDRIGADIVTGIAARLRWSNARTEKVIALTRGHMEDESPLHEADSEAK